MPPQRRLPGPRAAGWPLALLLACGEPAAPAPLSAPKLLERYRLELPLPEALQPSIQRASAQWASLADREQVLLGRYRRGPEAKVLLDLGVLYSQAEKSDLALTCLAAAAAEPQYLTEACAWSSVARFTAGELAEARLLAEHALGLDPKQGIAAAVLGRVALRQGDRELARTQLRRAADLLPTDGNLALEAAELAEERGELELAGRLLERPLRQDPNHPALLYRLAQVREAQGLVLEAEALRQRHERAVLIDDLGLRAGGQPPDVVACALGVHFDEQGQPAKAYPEFQAARARTRDRELLATCLAGVAHSGAQIGQAAEARRALEELRVLAPDHPMLAQIEAAFRKHGLDPE